MASHPKKIQRPAGVVALVVLFIATVVMVRHPGFFGEEAELEALFHAHPEGFAACGARYEYIYETGISRGIPSVHHRKRFELVPLAAGDRLVYRFQPREKPEQGILISFSPSGDSPRAYRVSGAASPESDTAFELLAIAGAFGKALHHQPGHRVIEFSFDENIGEARHLHHVWGRSLLLDTSRVPTRDIRRCLQTREAEVVREEKLMVSEAE